MSKSNVPPYKLVLTGGPDSMVPIEESEHAYIAAISEDDPPSSAHILFTSLQFPARLKAQLRENLKRQKIPVINQIEVTPAELEQIYSNTNSFVQALPSDLNYERALDSIRVLLARAVSNDASDIHIVRRQRTALVSFRVDGQIVPYAEWSEHTADQTCRFIYEVMGYDQEVTWNRHEPQDAVVDTRLVNGRRIRVRVGTIPASPDGYDMVLRILPGSGDTLHLSELGYDAHQVQAIHMLTRRPSGLAVMAGGVGSGKSTAIVGMLLEELKTHESRLRIITIEDPPERVIPGATQVPVVRKRGTAAGDEFSFAIRGALRCDPDTLMVGEIRDLQSAVLTIKFAQSGHRVYTTVHASTAIGIVGRLIGLGVDPSLLCTPDVLKGLIYQTLVPLLCSSCKITTKEWLAENHVDKTRRRELAERVSKALGIRGLDVRKVAYRSAGGCKNCANSGVIGRTLMAEIALPDDEMLSQLRVGNYTAAHRHWLEYLNGQPVTEHGIRLLANGIASPPDVEWRIGPLSELLSLATAKHSNGIEDPAQAARSVEFGTSEPLAVERAHV